MPLPFSTSSQAPTPRVPHWPLVYRRGDGSAEVTTLSDASWANKSDMTNFHGWMKILCGAAFEYSSTGAFVDAQGRAAHQP